MPGRGHIPVTICLLLGVVFPPAAWSEWTVVRLSDPGETDAETMVAYTENPEGYSLEIYRDQVNAIRSRLTLPDGLLAFADRVCPTYQVDRGNPQNRSINNAPCLSDTDWSEYILGYIENNHVRSSPLLSVMNGINIIYRFKLANGDYDSTGFSLQGSKRALTIVLGEDVTISQN